MSRTRRFLDGVLFGYTQQIVVILTGLWLTPFLLHHIGQNDYGLWLVGLQILTWLTLMDLGIVGLLPRETAYALGRAGTVEEATDLPHLIAQTSRIVLLQWPLVAMAAALCWLYLPSTSSSLRGPIAVVGMAFVLSFPLRVFRAVLEGLQDLHFLGRLQIACWAAGVVVSVSMVLSGFHLYSLAAGWAVTQLSSALFWFLRVKAKYPFILPSSLSSAPLLSLSAQFSRGFWVSLAQIAQLLLDGSDLLVIGKTMGARSVVPYSCTEKLIGVLANQPTMLMHAASPGLSAIKSGGDRTQALKVVVNLTQALLLLTGIVICVVLAVNRAFVSLWVGPRQFAGSSLNLLLVAAMLLRHWNVSVVYAIFCFGYERRLSITTLGDGFVTLVATFLLVLRFGLIGAPLGSMLGVCFVSLPFNLSALARESGKSVRAAVGPLWPWFWRFFLLAVGSWALSGVWFPASLFGVGLLSFLVSCTYAVVMLPMLMRSSLRTHLPKSLILYWNRWTGYRLQPVLPSKP